LGYNGDLYPTAGADVVMTTSGDLVKFTTARARLPIGSANQILQVKSSLPSWQTVPLADTVLTTSGDILFENNTPELARLPKGSDADVLTLSSGLPSWSAPSSGGMGSLVNSTTLGSDANDITTTFTAIPQSGISTIRCVANGDFSGTGGSLSLQVNGLTTSTYEYTQLGTYDGTSLDINTKTGHAFYKLFVGTNAPFYSTFDVSCNTVTDTINIQSLTGQSDTSANSGVYTVQGSNSTASQTSITGIKLYIDSGSINLLQGTTLSIYKMTI